MRQMTGIRRGQIETYIDQLVELHFNFIKDEITEAVLLQLQILTCTNNATLVVAEANEILTNEEFETLTMISDLFKRQNDAFPTIQINSNADRQEIEYATQRKLFHCLSEYISTNELTSEYAWISQANQNLTNKFRSLPQQHLILPNYTEALYTASICFFTLILLAGFLHCNYLLYMAITAQDDANDYPILTNIVCIIGVGLQISKAVRLLPMIRNFLPQLNNMMDALQEKTLPRVVQARLPAGETWEEACQKQFQALQENKSNSPAEQMSSSPTP